MFGTFRDLSALGAYRRSCLFIAQQAESLLQQLRALNLQHHIRRTINSLRENLLTLPLLLLSAGPS